VTAERKRGPLHSTASRSLQPNLESASAISSYIGPLRLDTEVDEVEPLRRRAMRRSEVHAPLSR
jgi:hypothetical protein